MKLEPVIGLEIHVELATKTKLFCGCPNKFSELPNTQVCPVCLGLPGVLPVLNQKAVEFLLRTGFALGGKIPEKSKFDRKNYFYPDMPKNYQISQYDLPLVIQGSVKIYTGENTRKIRIHRIHLEEDTGKSIHAAPQAKESSESSPVIGGRIGYSAYTLLDYNRAGVPLAEIVTEPDLRSPEEAVEFLQKLRLILQYLEVSDCKMEEGKMRCDANVSLRPAGNQELGVKVEIKNMNSFKSVREALLHEIERQSTALASGNSIAQETRGWDEDKRITFLMRSKEEAHDYRYFPEPDLVPLKIEEEWQSKLRAAIPELPDSKHERYRKKLGLSDEEASFLIGTLPLSIFFDKTLALKQSPREICNWLKGDISKYLNEQGTEIQHTQLTPQSLAELILLLEEGTISGKIAKEILPELLSKGGGPSHLVETKGLKQISNEETLNAVIHEVLNDPASLKAIQEYQAGKERAFGFLVGFVMKKTAGKANPVLMNKLLKNALDSEGFLPKK